MAYTEFDTYSLTYLFTYSLWFFKYCLFEIGDAHNFIEAGLFFFRQADTLL